MFVQYLDIKQSHPDSLLFFRMGDFYEMFFDDAVAAAAALDIALTKRGQYRGEPVPMCGVPAHSHESYLQRLIRKGFKVAICEQTEDPATARRRGSKALVNRDVVRVVTAGTLTEDALLESRANNHLAALARAGGGFALAWLDMSTGDFAVAEADPAGLGALLAQVAPGELLVAEALLDGGPMATALAPWRADITALPQARFDGTNAARHLLNHFEVATMESFGGYSRAEITAAGVLIDYVALTQKGQMPRLTPPRRQLPRMVMAIDAATRRNLELTQAISGERAHTLLKAIDRTLTGAGARLLAARLAAPLTDRAAIETRLEAVAACVVTAQVRQLIRDRLRGAPDLERGFNRLMLGRGGPRDLAAVRDALARADGLRHELTGRGAPAAITALQAEATALGSHETLVDRLSRALADELPLAARDGGFIAPGYAAELDNLRTLRDQSRRLVVELEARYRQQTGINALKLRHNNMLGYYVEVPQAHVEKLSGRPDQAFIHRQTLANAARFATAELSQLEQEIASAAERALALELTLMDDLIGEVRARGDAIAAAARAMATLDVAAALAELAIEHRYCRPEIVDSTEFVIVGGRHPVVEQLAVAQDPGGDGFVANDCTLGDDDRLWLLTGPNMAGKSTFLRQNALIAILAQMGAFVPATHARIGIIDRLFSRVGAADDLARGRSTFMVEMVETAAILNQAGPRALVILDEIGRGTATYDGLSIAWATIEHLHERNRCRALFATHYHELTALAAKLPALNCHTMRVREWQDRIVFLYDVGPGSADRSYGIHVARLAGLPPAVIARAEQVLAALEQDSRTSSAMRLAEDLPLFAAAWGTAGAGDDAAQPQTSDILNALADIDPDALSPRQALELVYRLKELASAPS